MTDQEQQQDAKTTSPEASMEEMLKQGDFDFKPLKAGDIRKGVIVRIEQGRMAVDIGGKKEGFIPSAELEKLSAEQRERLQVGQEVTVFVVRAETSSGEAELSLSQAKQFEDWEKAEKMQASGEIFEGVVSTFNKGGLIVPFGRLRGFIPASQVASRPPGAGTPPAEGQPADDSWLQRMVGQKLPMKIIEVDQQRRRLIFSERQAMRQWRKSQRERLMEELQEGQIRTGKISNLTEFGAFVDLGGVDGLIHVSEISYERVKHPSDALRIGEEVSVVVLRIEKEKGRIALSIKKTRPDPWQNITDRYQRGQSVEGTVTNVTDFGAFVQLEPGVEGLVHVSEMQGQPRLKSGERVALRILNVDPLKQRISLEPKMADAAGDQAQPNP